MEEELVMKGRDNEALLAKFDDRLKGFPNYKKSKFGKSNQFSIVHYAGEVIYEVEGFLQKNMDHASDAVVQAIHSMDIMGVWPEN